MKKIILPLLLLTLLLALLVSCQAAPVATVVGCEFLSAANGVETWRLTYSDGTTSEMTVKGPGLSVTSCQKTAEDGLVDTWGITFSDGSVASFTVANGALGASPTVTSCCMTVETPEESTWRITFSDGGTAEFTVPKPAESEGGTGDAEWQSVLTKVEALFSALNIKKLPSLTEGNRTVSTTAGASATEGISSTFTGWASLMTKDIMFGEAEEVVAIVLKGYNLEVGKLDTVPLDIHFIDISDAGDFTTASVFRTYTVEVTPAGVDDYLLEVKISKDDLAELDDEFMLGFETKGTTRVGMKPSRNSSYFAKNDPLHASYKTIGSTNYYDWSGYYTQAENGTRNRARATSPTVPDIFFSTAYEEEYSFDGSLGGAAGEEDMNVEDLLQLPPQYDLVVGDTFELFYKGITKCVDSDVYDYELSYASGKNLGKGYARKYVWTPTPNDVGVHTLNVKVWSNEGVLLDSGTVKMNVVAAPASPDEEKVVLIIGDSLTSGGVWPAELGRRLTGTGGTPAGLGLTNITFIGSKVKNGVRYEGYGGWNFGSYTTANQRNDFMILTGDFSDKNEAVDQHSTYKDAANQYWKIEWVTATEMKVICTSATGALPSTTGGTLTHYSGGQNTGDIVYTSARRADANPFWDASAEKNDFVAYAESFGETKIDEVILFMGWNHYSNTPEQFKGQAKKLIDSILADFPDCHISLVGLQIPSRDGFGQNYGISWPWFKMLGQVFAFQNAYVELAADPNYADSLSVVSVAGQYDAVYNQIIVNAPVNNRNPATEQVGSNGVHPSDYGYLQIADAIYRHMCARLAN